MPKIKTIWFHDLKSKLDGDAIAVDVWGATLNINILLSKKPRHLIVVNEINLKKARITYADAFLVGESRIWPASSFYTSNQPGDIDRVPTRGKDILWMSANGSRVIEKAMVLAKGGVFTGSTGNIKALANYFGKKKGNLNIILAGNLDEELEEDRICGELIRKSILGLSIDWDKEVKKIMHAIKTRYEPHNWKGDLHLIPLYLNKLNNIPKGIVNEKGFIEMVAQ